MIVIFDRQHYGKPGKNDQGAGFDLDGDGRIETQERETQLTPLYYRPAKERLEAMGHKVVILDSGWYSDRHKRANQIALSNPGERVVYLACHVNAGGGDYAAAIYDARSAGGKRLAEAVTAQLAGLPGIRRVRAARGTPTNGWKRGYATVKGIYAGPANISGMCLEPYFIDRPEHRFLASVQGGKLIADKLVAALLAW